MSKTRRRSIYDNLSCDIAATIPRNLARETWLPPSKDPRPISFLECSLNDTRMMDLDLPNKNGYVKQKTSFFEAKPLSPSLPRDKPKPQQDVTKVIKYKTKRFDYPQPYPRRQTDRPLQYTITSSKDTEDIPEKPKLKARKQAVPRRHTTTVYLPSDHKQDIKPQYLNSEPDGNPLHLLNKEDTSPVKPLQFTETNSNDTEYILDKPSQKQRKSEVPSRHATTIYMSNPPSDVHQYNQQFINPDVNVIQGANDEIFLIQPLQKTGSNSNNTEYMPDKPNRKHQKPVVPRRHASTIYMSKPSDLHQIVNNSEQYDQEFDNPEFTVIHGIKDKPIPIKPVQYTISNKKDTEYIPNKPNHKQRKPAVPRRHTSTIFMSNPPRDVHQAMNNYEWHSQEYNNTQDETIPIKPLKYTNSKDTDSIPDKPNRHPQKPSVPRRHTSTVYLTPSDLQQGMIDPQYINPKLNVIPVRRGLTENENLPVSVNPDVFVNGSNATSRSILSPDLERRLASYRCYTIDDDTTMNDYYNLDYFTIPRVVGVSAKNYREIPKELFDSLPESSVDPDEDQREINSQWRTMIEGRRALFMKDEVPQNQFKIRKNSKKYQNYEQENQNCGIQYATDGHSKNSSPRNHVRGVSCPESPRATTPALPVHSEANTPIVHSSTHPPTPPIRSGRRDTQSKEYLMQLERELKDAGIFFRLPQTPAERETPGEIDEALATLDESIKEFITDEESASENLSHQSCDIKPQQSRIESDGDNAGQKLQSSTSNLSVVDAREKKEDMPQNVSSDIPHKTVIHLDGNSINNINNDSDISVNDNPETFNLIEEVYVKSGTKILPQSTVKIKAYYPEVQYSKESQPVHIQIDNDSGHESGATSPCGTLTGDDTTSPPPSPLCPKGSTDETTVKSSKDKTNFKSFSKYDTNVHSNTQDKSKSKQNSNVQSAVVCETSQPQSIPGLKKETTSLHFVVVAIDFGTTYSGYAFSFTQDPENIHMMKKWEGGDPGVQNQKTPTIVLLDPQKEFHSLGFTARDTFHDLDPKEAQKWLYFDKFKMDLHSNQYLSRETQLTAKNGQKISALKIFSYALRFFRDHALKELSDQTGFKVEEEDVRWVITVPAIWSFPAKQFMRTAAYKADMGSPEKPDRLLIALEPEAAAIYCRKLRQNQLVHEKSLDARLRRTSLISASDVSLEEKCALPELKRGTIYMVVDCGGGTVDITVHQMTDSNCGHLKELHKATGGPYGSIAIDREFEELLNTVFGAEFMEAFKKQRSAAYVDLMIAFESRKRNASICKSSPLNIALPFSFIDLFRKTTKKEVESAIRKHSHLGIKWSSQGMLRIEQDTMKALFKSTLDKISESIRTVLESPEVDKIEYMFLVGGFSESELVQKHIRDAFGTETAVIIPQGMGLAILRGAVQFGLDPSVVSVRRSRLTYGVGVLNRFEEGVHSPEKKVISNGQEWCADILDKFVSVDESVAIGDVVTRSYTPATRNQKSVILHFYATQKDGVQYITDPTVQRVGTLRLDLNSLPQASEKQSKTGHFKREITVHLRFGGTEVRASALDNLTGSEVNVDIEFLSL